MRYLLTIGSLIIFSCIYSQQMRTDSTTNAPQGEMVRGTNSTLLVEKPVVRMRFASINSSEPLYVINGLLVEANELTKINPDDIESINILKKCDQVKIYCGVLKDVIVITTKSSNVRKFIVRDFVSGEKVAGATLCFISKEKRDTLMFVADDSGVVVTDKIKSNDDYEIIVSSVGYKTLSVTSTKSKSQDFLLERDVKENSEVRVTCAGRYRRNNLQIIHNKICRFGQTK